jgi:hypothetical protein
VGEGPPNGHEWLIAAALHVLVVVLFLVAPLQAPRRRADYIVLQPPDTGTMMVYMPGARGLPSRSRPDTTARRDSLRSRTTSATPAAAKLAERRDPSVAVTTTVAAAVAAAVAPSPALAAPSPPHAAPSPPDTAPTMPAYDPNASRVAPAPSVGDGRLWVSPRPGLPGSVAAVLYGDTTGRRDAAIERLRAMVDSLNEILDQEQRERRRPSWTVGGTPENPTWGLDSAYIHIAGIKIPTPVLALLGAIKGFPQGNFDEEMHARQLNYMRQDILQAADRAQSLQEFKRYVRELRERRQAERDAEERRRGQDTVKAVP